MKRPKVALLSHTINKDTPVYGGKPLIALKQMRSIDAGDSCNQMLWRFSNHTGTHIDAPLHFIKRGKSVVDYNPACWIFNRVSIVRLSNITAGRIIDRHDLKAISDCEILLMKTGFEKYRDKRLYWQDSPGLSPDLALWLKDRCPSLRAVGLDFISVSNLNKRQLGRQAHKAFLKNNILLVEDMKLSAIKRKPDILVLAPLLIEGADGSPCTALGIYN